MTHGDCEQITDMHVAPAPALGGFDIPGRYKQVESTWMDAETQRCRQRERLAVDPGERSATPSADFELGARELVPEGTPRALSHGLCRHEPGVSARVCVFTRRLRADRCQVGGARR